MQTKQNSEGECGAFGSWIADQQLAIGSWYIISTEFRIAGGSVAVPSFDIGEAECDESCGENARWYGGSGVDATSLA